MTPDELLARAEKRRVSTLSHLPPSRQAELGQFFTNSPCAQFMASLVRLPESGTLRVLDPGAGSGALSAALVARAVTESPQLRIEVTAVEVDAAAARALAATLDECAEAAKQAGVEFEATVIEDSFVDVALSLHDSFDVVIQNPPYFKLAADDPIRAHTAALSVDPPNIYAAFVALGTAALADGGQLVAITPRSFTNGTYFRPFREWLLERAVFNRIHIFDARNSVFADTGVLQENIIYSMTKSTDTPATAELSLSRDHQDEATVRQVGYAEVIHPKDKQLYIRIPSSPEDAEVVGLMSALPCSLSDMGLKASTGRVVDFRSRDQLIEPPLDEHYPMVYPANISHGVLSHPKPNTKTQWFSITAEADRKWLVPTGTYVLVKRFSSKEEKRRLVAGIWSSDAPVAFDNKLNYFHLGGKPMDFPLAMGLAIWLNSDAVDRYFRTFSGHTQVNATDLRGMKYPSASTLRALGAGHQVLPEADIIDALVDGIITPKEATA